MPPESPPPDRPDQCSVSVCNGRLVLVEMADGWAVFDRWTAAIHVASPLAGLVLRRLADGGPAPEEALVRWLEREFEMKGADGDPGTQMAAVIRELAAAGLVADVDEGSPAIIAGPDGVRA